MGKLLDKPTSRVKIETSSGRFEKFNLRENPFPSSPFVNRDSDDDRINGTIFEMEIRKKEFEQITDQFLKVPQNDMNHLRLGYIIDTSYVGRGNGKSAFLLNLLDRINKNFCLDLSDRINKCFAVYISPEAGGRTKSFDNFVDSFFNAILNSKIIDISLAILRFEALDESHKTSLSSCDDNELVNNLNSQAWFHNEAIDLSELSQKMLKNTALKSLPMEFPLFQGSSILFNRVITQTDFRNYYTNLKRGRDKLDFIFSNLVDFFLAADFNGAYIFVDDYERIPDFQSARQKRDFALELRSCLFDGIYTNAKIGFYNFLLVFHAGVPRLIQDAWSDSGMESRAPIFPAQSHPRHIIHFEKITKEHAKLLLETYLSYFRIKNQEGLFPFAESAAYRIAELSELNASKMLKLAYEVLDEAARREQISKITESFVTEISETKALEDKPRKSIADEETTDLMKKAKSRRVKKKK